MTQLNQIDKILRMKEFRNLILVWRSTTGYFCVRNKVTGESRVYNIKALVL